MRSSSSNSSVAVAAAAGLAGFITRRSSLIAHRLFEHKQQLQLQLADRISSNYSRHPEQQQHNDLMTADEDGEHYDNDNKSSSGDDDDEGGLSDDDDMNPGSASPYLGPGAGGDGVPRYPVLEINCRSKISCLSWNSYIKSQLLSSDYEGLVSLYDSNTGTPVCIFNEHEKRAWSVDFSVVDPLRFASGGDDTKGKIMKEKKRGLRWTLLM